MTLSDYSNLWNTTVVDLSKNYEIAGCAAQILKNWAIYTAVKNQTDIPEWVTGVIHYRESSFNLHTWLANGDPLFDHYGTPLETTHVPRGLGPCTTWQDAAVLSFQNNKISKNTDWSLPSALYQLECWNGKGYMNQGILSPYLWSGTNHYTIGKYSSDGNYDPILKDLQLGCVPILNGLQISGIVFS